MILLAILSLASSATFGSAHAQVADSTLNKRFQLAESFMRAGQYDRALPLLEELYRARPEAYVFYDRLKTVYENLKRYGEAIALVNTQLDANPLPVHLAERARLQYLAGMEEAAQASWEEALSTRPDDPTVYRAVYQSMYQVRLIDEAISVLERGRMAVGEADGFHSELAALFVVNGEYDRAMGEYLTLLLKDERQLGYVRSRLGRLADEPQAMEAAVRLTEQAVRRHPQSGPVRELMAWLYLENGQFLPALDAFRALDRLGEKDGRALFNFAQQAGDAGAFEAASSAYGELLRRYPDSVIAPDALYGVASMHEQWGRALGEEASPAANSPTATPHTDEAMQTYRLLLDEHPRHALAPAARYQIAQLQWNFYGQRDAAEAALRQLIETTPRHPLAREAELDLGMIAVERGQLVEARRIFARIVGADAQSELVERARYQLALAHLYEGDVETALTVTAAVNRNTSMDIANDAIELRVLLQENKGPDSLNTVLKSYGQVLYLQRLGATEDALREIDALLRANGNHPIADDARFTRAALLHASGAYEASWKAYAEIPMYHRGSPLADRALFRAAEILSDDLENDEEALKYYTRLLTEYPGSVLTAEARTRIRLLRGDGV